MAIRRRRRKYRKTNTKASNIVKLLVVFTVIVALLSAAIIANVLKRHGIDNDEKQEWLNIISSDIDSENFKRQKGKKLVCLDPGHGFDDAGAASSVNGKPVLYERDINADVCIRVKKILEENGVQVLMTYGSNTRPDYDDGSVRKYSLDARVNKTNKYKADLFVSIHCDSYVGVETNTAKGTRIYYCNSILNNRGGKSKKLAENISAGVKKKADSRDSVEMGMNVYDAYQVIRDTNMPAALVELAFLSDESDYNKLNNAQWRDKMAQGIAYGIVKSLE